MKKFKEFQFNQVQMSKIFGSGPVDTTLANCNDCIDDTNGNGKLDPGECLEINEC